MKRSVFIIIGVILVVLLLVVWVYVMFIGTPNNPNDQFADFGFDDTTDQNYQEPVVEPADEPLVNMDANKRLRQLTTRPVAGFVEIAATASSTATVLYAEVGTGHIYSIDLATGAEERVSATTIPATQDAEFSAGGEYVMMQSGFAANREFIIGEIDYEQQTLSNTELNEQITSFSGTTDNRFLYAIQTNAATIGKAFSPAELTSETLFTLPFRESSINWGAAVGDAHYVYPKTTRQLESFLYQVKNGAVTRMPVAGYGMSAVGSDDYVLFSRQENDSYQTYYLNNKTDTNHLSPLVQIPEKCVISAGRFPVTICASTQYSVTSLLPDSWYKGELSSADNLWEFTLEEGAARLLVNTEVESGRQLDIVDLTVSANGSNVYFTNQTDQALWMYERLMTDSN